MYGFLKFLIVIGVVLWLFLLWDKMETKKYEANLDNAETADRCAEFRQDIDDENWSLGYGGRVRQIMRGCF